jgi:hypothetical protein
MRKKSGLVRFAWISLIAAATAGLSGAQTVATVSGGRLALTTPGGDQSVKVEVSSGLARVFGFPGLADGTSYSGLTGLTVLTGAGADSVEVEVRSVGSFDVNLDTGAGAATTKVNWAILPGGSNPAANITVNSDTNVDQKLNVEVESASQNAAVSIQTGELSEISTKVNSSNVSDALRVVFGATAPKTALEVGSNASALEVSVAAGASAATDELVYKITQSRPAEVSLNWAIDAGAGDDKVEAFVAAPGSTVTQRGNVLGRGGNDQLLFDTSAFSTVTGLTLNGGPGADELSQVIQGRFQASQTLRSRMLGADGDDSLRLTTDTGIFGTGLPNDLFPIIDCGPGNDGFNAFGVVRGCEFRF